MSRRADMTDDGKIPCGLCKEWKFIGEFYTQKVYEGLTSFKAIWWGDPTTGKQYGRPNSYCKKCNLVSQKGSTKVDEFKTLVKAHSTTRVRDVREAWLQALEEESDRYPQDPIESMKAYAREVAVELSRNGPS